MFLFLRCELTGINSIDTWCRALEFRSMDRNANMMSYPKLHYPNIYVLMGGYREFYHTFMVNSRLYQKPI